MNLDALPPMLTADNPWPGLQSFSEDAREFFHGRGDEIETLLRLIRRERLTIFYGQSGLGKTSLLRAGLFPQLRPLSLLPVSLRLDYSEEAPPLCEQVKQALVGAFRACHIEAITPALNDSLWSYFHRDDVDFWDARNRLVVPVLVFDQFEERFTLGRRSAEVDAEAEAFLSELSQLVENRPPPALLAKFEADPDAALGYDFEKQTCKVVLTLREDFLPELEGLLDRFPSLHKSCFRLLPMSKTQAVQVVLGSGSHLVSETVASGIVDFVAYSRQHHSAGEVEPALLSLVLQELNLRRLQRGEAQISADLLSGSKEKILEEFYERAVKDLPVNARLFLEDGLLTGSGYRDSIPWENAHSEFGLDDECLSVLINRHLIRREERLGLTRLELVHDLLTSVIADSRRRRLEQEHWRQEYEKEWRSKNEKAVAVAARINTAAEEWSKDRRGMISLLLKGPPLCQAAELLEKHPDLLKPPARDFVDESQRTRRQGRLLWSAVAGLTLLLSFYYAQWIGSGYDGFVPVLLRTIAVTVTPCILSVLDRLPKWTTRRTLSASVWRWSIYSWGAFLIISYSFAIPNNFAQSFQTFLFISPILLVPVFKWKAYMAACRQTLQPGPRSPFAPRVALFVTAALLPAVIVTVKFHGALFLQAESVTTDFTTNNEGWIVKTVTHFSKHDGKVGEVSYFQPAALSEGNYKVAHKYDRRGNAIESTALDFEGKPVTRSDGYVTVKREFDARGKIKRATFHGVNGEPVQLKDGKYGWTAECDAKGNEVVWTALGLDGKPLVLSDGYATIKKEYDTRGKVKRLSYYGIDGNPILHKNGYHGLGFEYDARGNEIVWTTLGLDGKPVALSDGYATIKKEYNARGNVSRVTYYGVNGEPVQHKNGGYGRTAEYDARGNEIKTTGIGLDGKPVALSDGYATIKREYNARGKVSRMAYYGVSGEPVQHKNGRYGWTAEYDQAGNEVVWTALGLDGKPALLREGYATIKRNHNEHGNEIEWACFDEHDQPTECSNGYHKTTFKYGPNNTKIGATYWDTNNHRLDPLAIVRKAAKSDFESKKTFLSDLLGNASWDALLGSNPREAILYAEEALKIDPSRKWVITNQAHGYLFSGQFEKAQAIYFGNKDVEIDLNGSKTTFRQAVLNDIKVFRENGLTHPDLAKIEALLGAVLREKEP